MKISNSLQKKYCALAGESKFVEMENLYLSTAEKFDLVYCIHHGLLNKEKLSVLIFKAYEANETSVSVYWSISAKGAQKSVIMWLSSTNRLFFSRSVARLICLGFRLTREEHKEMLFGKLKSHTLSLQLTEFSGNAQNVANQKALVDKVVMQDAPRDLIEEAGENYFSWLLRYGSIDNLEMNYEPGILTKQVNKVPFINFIKNKKEIQVWVQQKIKEENIQVKALDLTLNSETKFVFRQELLLDVYTKDLFKELKIREPKLIAAIKRYYEKETTFNYSLINALVNIQSEVSRFVFFDSQLANIVNTLSRKHIYNEVPLNEILDFLNTHTTYSDYRKRKIILIGCSLGNFKDIKNMLVNKTEAAKAFKIPLLPDKPSSLIDIHNWLVRIPEKLEVNREIKHLMQEKLPEYENEAYRVYYPESDVMFIKSGLELSICVGDLSYRDSVINKEISIIIIKDKKENSVACVEFNSQADIIQAFSHGNEEVSLEVFEFINSLREQWLSLK